jgi:transcriptional antiterminator Rof (Rho-off)
VSLSFRVFWVVSLVFLVAGCSGYRTLEIPATDAYQGPGTSPVPGLERGDEVRLTLRSGESIEGTAVDFGAGAIVLDALSPATEAGAGNEILSLDSAGSIENREIRLEEIESLEKTQFDTATAAIAGGILFLGVAILFISAGSSDETPSLYPSTD